MVLHVHYDVRVEVVVRADSEAEAVNRAIAAANTSMLEFVRRLEREKGWTPTALPKQIRGEPASHSYPYGWGSLKVDSVRRMRFNRYRVVVRGLWFLNVRSYELCTICGAVVRGLVLGAARSLTRMLGRWLREVLKVIAGLVAKVLALLSLVIALKEIASRVVRVIVEEAGEAVGRSPLLGAGLILLAAVLLSGGGEE